MSFSEKRRCQKFWQRLLLRTNAILLTISLIIGPCPTSFAQGFFMSGLPEPGSMVSLSQPFAPPLVRGLVVHPEDPLKFDFIVDQGQNPLSPEDLNAVSQKMVNYFLAALTVPQQDLWVNLSPVEKDRIIPDELIRTELGRDLLAQDYLLKQLTASLIYPEDDLGQAFWKKVYDEAYAQFGVTDVPVDTFNKVWILPERASVFEKGNTVYVTKIHLKVMLEADYFAASRHPEASAEGSPVLNGRKPNNAGGPSTRLASGGLAQDDVSSFSLSSTQELSKHILREVIVPAIEKEVNEGEHFAALRQIVYAMTLAQWYEDALEDSILNKVYAGQGKVAGIDLSDPKNKELIYAQYMAAYKKGVFNYIKEQADPATGDVVPRKYFSGGFAGQKIPREATDWAMDGSGARPSSQMLVQVGLVGASSTEVAIGGEKKKILGRELGDYLHELQHPGPDQRGVVSDVSLEAFLDPIKGPAQLALGKGGLGFLTGETWGAYSDLEHWRATGAMPLYSFDKEGKEIDWDHQEGIDPVMVKGEDGEETILSFDVEFKGKKERVSIYWVNAHGTPVFLIKQETIFRKLYPGGDEQTAQYGFLGKAYVELMNVLGVAPRILRLSEPQLVFVWCAMQNDVEANDGGGVFSLTQPVMTTHTPERAALPSWNNVPWLKSVVGDDLVRDDIVFNGEVNAAGALAHHAVIVNGVSPEHGDITRWIVLPHVAGKTTAVQNGSDPLLWRSDELNGLVYNKGLENITGEELYALGVLQKIRLNEYLKANGFASFDDMDRPLFAAVRRFVEYKSQAIFLTLVRWIVGDPNKEYDTPLGKVKGLGANFLLGGEALDDIAPEWMKQFKTLVEDPEIKGRFVLAERTTGTKFMQLATSAADGWLVMPWVTREASGTSDQRAGLNGRLVIATATGGPVEWIQHGEGGWLVSPFEDIEQELSQGGLQAIARAFQNKEAWALTRFYEEGRRQFARYMQALVEMYREPGQARLHKAMQNSFQAAHRRVSIHRMVKEYGLLFDAVDEGVGVAGFEQKQAEFSRKWDDERLWQKDDQLLSFDQPVEGRAVALSVRINGYDPVRLPFSRSAQGDGFELEAEEGVIPVVDQTNIYVVRSGEEMKVVSSKTVEQDAEATWLRLYVEDEKIVVSMVHSGGLPVRVSVVDAAQEVNGGIDVRNIDVDRQGQLITGVLTDQAMVDVLRNAPGVRGVIVGITPIADLPAFLGAK